MRRARGLVWPLVACLAVGLAARTMLDVVEVRGRSMLPALHPGDRLVVARRIGGLRRGAVVLAPDPRDPRRELIKRVVAVEPGGIRLAGDNPAESTDARTFGPVPDRAIRWRVLLRYWPLGRIGLVRAARPSSASGAGWAPARPFGA